MRNLFNLLLPLLMAGTSLDGSLYSIVTKKDDAIVNKKYTKFIVVDEATHYVLAKTPAIYDASKEMPVNYFTLDFSDIVSSQQRLFTIHNLTDSNGGDEYDWVLEDNADENAIFFTQQFCYTKAIHALENGCAGRTRSFTKSTNRLICQNEP